jgi:cytoplasmic tRNA 2-thiolation protein 1
MVLCKYCQNARGIIRRSRDGTSACKECFFYYFEEEIHQTISGSIPLTSGERVAIAASGGKDSTVLAHIMTLLNERHNYALDMVLLSVDEGIRGYRDDSLATVHRNKEQYKLPLSIVSYKDLYQGWTMDRVVEKIGRKNNCTFCGVFRRQALDRGASHLGVQRIFTGHNADDMAETVLMNLLRGDISRLSRCTDITTGTLPSTSSCGTMAHDDGEELARVVRSKPFKYAYEKEIVMYAYLKKLDYFSTECTYAPNAYRGNARSFLKELERIRPRSILDIISSGEAIRQIMGDKTKQREQTTCERCGYIASNRFCKACMLLEGLCNGQPIENH